MAPATKKIRRRPAAGEFTIAQTRELAQVASLLTAAGMLAAGVDAPGGCYLMAQVGGETAGVIGIEARVDAALLRSLMVIEPMRRRGIGAALVAAARTAAHTRGTRTLYAIALKRLAPSGAPVADASLRVAEFATAGYFERFGFVPETTENLIAALAGTFVVDYLRARPDQLARCEVLSLDISNDGVILR